MTSDQDRKELAHIDLRQAVHFAAKRFPGGIGAIAGAYGYNPHTLQNKLNPTQPGTPNLEEFEAVLLSTRSPLILDAIGRLTRTTWLDMSQFDRVGDMAILDSVTALVSRVGRLTTDLQQAIEDGDVSEPELATLEVDLAALCAAGHAVVERARQMRPKGKK